MARAVVADAGPLIGFGRIGRLKLLPDVLGEVMVPKLVLDECLADRSRPGAAAISKALELGWLLKVPDPRPALPVLDMLDAGESSAIRLALRLSVPVLMDEKAGRRIAGNLGIVVIGSGGVLLAAKRAGLIEAVRPLLNALRDGGYHFSDALVRAITLRAGEG